MAATLRSIGAGLRPEWPLKGGDARSVIPKRSALDRHSQEIHLYIARLEIAQKWPTAIRICDIARSGAGRACYQVIRLKVRQRFPSRSLKPFPHTQGFDQTPTG